TLSLQFHKKRRLFKSLVESYIQIAAISKELKYQKKRPSLQHLRILSLKREDLRTNQV
ncbi:MAG: hypothetical protein EZS28_034989, partial [Streblomastix strix]